VVFRTIMKVDTKALKDVQWIGEQAPVLVVRYLTKVLWPELQEMAETFLSIEPGPPSYPLRWASERQRRYVMAKLRRENNLPYTRTHAFSQNWEVRPHLTDNSGFMIVENDAMTDSGEPLQDFIVGHRQQPFHKDTGWYRIEDEIEDLSVYASDQLKEFWAETMTMHDIYPEVKV